MIETGFFLKTRFLKFWGEEIRFSGYNPPEIGFTGTINTVQ